MNFNPLSWFGRGGAATPGGLRKSNDVGSSAVVRASEALGPWSGPLGGFQARKINPSFYEALRESIGPLDGAIEKTVTLDGLLEVEGGNDALTQLIQRELIGNLPVNDLGAGLQTFYAIHGNEMYEQGFGVGELVFDRRGRELIGLRIADSKGVAYRRNPDTQQLETWYRPPCPPKSGRRDGTDAIETLLRNGNFSGDLAGVLSQWGYVELDSRTLVHIARSPEADNPYGVSLLRGIEFVSQILLRMQNATGQVWERFGDPVFHISYKTKNRGIKGSDLEARRRKLHDDLRDAMVAKSRGNSADFVTAVAADDDVVVSVIGAEGQALEIEQPARHMMEQIVGKTELAPWLFGLQWSTSERMADNQSEIMLQAAKTRFITRTPGLNRIVETWLRGRGKTWKEGDWKLVQRLPNIRDTLKNAQAEFLQAQTQLMLGNGAPRARTPRAPTGQGGNDDPPSAEPGGGPKAARFRVKHDGTIDFDFPFEADLPLAHVHQHKAADTPEPFAESDPELPKIEQAAVDALLTAWHHLRDATLQALGLPSTRKAPEVFTFTPDMLAALLQVQQDMLAEATDPAGQFLQQVFAAWVRGVINAATDIDREAEAEQVIEAARAQAQLAVQARGLQFVRNTTIRSFEQAILPDITNGTYDGQNPREIAAALKKKFAKQEYDFVQLARSETADAQVRGKLAAFMRMGITRYGLLTAEGACIVCRNLAAEGPYDIGAGPLPIMDTHPNCRCSIRADMD